MFTHMAMFLRFLFVFAGVGSVLNSLVVVLSLIFVVLFVSVFPLFSCGALINHCGVS